MEGSRIAEYVQRFHDLSRVVPYMVEPEFKRVERFIWGLAPQILSMVTTSKPPTITEAIDLSVALTEEAVRLGKFSISKEKKETPVEPSGDNKRKFANFKKGTRAKSNNNAKKGKENGKRDNCGKVGHCKETCWHGTGRGKGGQGCYKCGDVGQFRKDCPREIKQDRGRMSNTGAREAR
ncbi:cold shock domain-containing protein 3-like [Helianthus annuus]|uniref:cold shock domain-containing protein 3-like n=1 Tax=Helianthus annuus TaxID=4232 RepID=UPI000B901A86|nr:cold shock domain-containing protein 3-like [Helianthus annuus]